MKTPVTVGITLLFDGQDYSWFDHPDNEKNMKKLIEIYQKSKPLDDRIQEGWKNFDGFMAQVLVRAVKVMKTAEVKWLEDRADKNSKPIIKPVENVILRKDMKIRFPEGNYTERIQDLKWFGLTSQRKEWWHQGIYQATPTTFDFISGRCTVPRSVRVSGTAVVETTREQVSFQEAMGAEWNTMSEWIAQWRGVGVPGR